MRLAITLRLVTEDGVYNAVQRLWHVGAIVAVLGVIASGLALWKPVQLHALTTPVGPGYEATRRVHFLPWPSSRCSWATPVLVAVVPRTLKVMLFGRLQPKGASV